MIYINEETNEIKMTRGDTLRAQVAVERDDEPYAPVAGDSVAFYLKHPDMTSRGKQYKDPEPLITKDVPIGTMLLQLDPADTKPLDFGPYKYDVEITFASGLVDTFINNADLTLLPEVG